MTLAELILCIVAMAIVVGGSILGFIQYKIHEKKQIEENEKHYEAFKKGLDFM